MKWDYHLHSSVKIDRPLSVDTDNNGNVYISAENLIEDEGVCFSITI